MRSGESSIDKRPHTRICVVQRISVGMKECERYGLQKKIEAVENARKRKKKKATTNELPAY